jgi:hypothetical protein
LTTLPDAERSSGDGEHSRRLNRPTLPLLEVRMMATQRNVEGSGWLRSRAGLALVFLAIAAFLLLTGHTAHVFEALPFLLILACPLLHLFIHGGHRGHTGQPGGHETKGE